MPYLDKCIVVEVECIYPDVYRLVRPLGSHVHA